MKIYYYSHETYEVGKTSKIRLRFFEKYEDAEKAFDANIKEFITKSPHYTAHLDEDTNLENPAHVLKDKRCVRQVHLRLREKAFYTWRPLWEVEME